jgi:hypothetical protein
LATAQAAHIHDDYYRLARRFFLFCYVDSLGVVVAAVVMLLSGAADLAAVIFVADVLLVATTFRFHKWLRNFVKAS